MTDELTVEQPFGVVRYRTIFSGVTAARVVPPRVRPVTGTASACASRLPGGRRRPPGSAGTRRNGRGSFRSASAVEARLGAASHHGPTYIVQRILNLVQRVSNLPK